MNIEEADVMTYYDTQYTTDDVTDRAILVVQQPEGQQEFASDLTQMKRTTAQAIRQPLYDKIAEEKERAMAAESGLDAALQAEIVRAKAAEDTKADKATTLAGYGITDAKIESSKITLGSTEFDLSTKVDKTTTINTHPLSNDVTVTAEDVGLGNVTNESKTTMFTNSEFTGTPTAPTAATDTNTTQIATTAFVNAHVNSKIAASQALVYKGIVDKSGEHDLPTDVTEVKVGWMYVVAEAGTYGGHECQVGDILIADKVEGTGITWTIIKKGAGVVMGPSSATNEDIAIFNGTTGDLIKDSGLKISDIVYEHPEGSAASKISGFYKFSTDSTSHINSVTEVKATDISALTGTFTLKAYNESGSTTTYTIYGKS